jgi:hypothetical protein
VVVDLSPRLVETSQLAASKGYLRYLILYFDLLLKENAQNYEQLFLILAATE